MRILSCVLLLLCYVGGEGVSQTPDVTPFLQEVRRQISTANPTWTETQSYADPERGRTNWRLGPSRDDWITVSVHIYSTPEHASEALREHTKFINVPPVGHQLAIGDELLVYRLMLKKESGSLYFRRGRLVVSVAAASYMEAERLAKGIDELALKMSP